MGNRLLSDLATIVDCEHKTVPAMVGAECYGFAVGTPALRSNQVDYSQSKPVSEDVFNLWTRRAVPTLGDLILAREAPVGGVARVDGRHRVCLGQRTVLIRCDAALVDTAWLYYYLVGTPAQAWMRTRSEGSTVVHLNVSDVRQIPVHPLPPLPEQRRIAGVLGALDDLIDTNQRLVANCRELAAAVYACPSGERTELASIAALYKKSVKHKSILAGTPYLGLEHFATNGGGITDFGDAKSVGSSKLEFSRGDVLYGKLRPYFRKVDRPGVDGVATSEVWVLRPINGYSAELVFSVVHSQQFTEWVAQGSGGTRMPRAVWGLAEQFPVHLPPKEELARRDHVAAQLWEAVWQLTEEANEMRGARDELLPLLMSGAVSPGEVTVAS